MSTGDLSIIVPAHNAAATLEAAIDSALEADGLLEVVVVDDGSTDDTLARANEMAAAMAGVGRPLLQVLSQPQAGPSAARNFGAANAEGELLAFLDADDTWVAGVPDPRREGLTGGLTVALGLIQYYVGDPAVPSGEPFAAFSACTALIPRDVFVSVGPFEPGMDLGEDVDWFLRARERRRRHRLRIRGRPGVPVPSGLVELSPGRPRARVAACAPPLAGPAEVSRGAPAMTAEPPTVTVLMPLLNGEPHLAEALAALRNQSRPPLETLVLDGGSTDGSRERVRDEAGVTLVDPPGGRLYPSLNAGMACAVGEIVVFASSDDTMEPRALECHAAALNGAPAAGYSVGKVRLFADEGGVSQQVPGTLAGTVRMVRLLETIAVRRPLLDVVGGFRDEIGTSADVEWLARLSDLGDSLGPGRCGRRVQAPAHGQHELHGRGRCGRPHTIAAPEHFAQAGPGMSGGNQGIAVIIPVRDGRRYLSEAIVSAQTQVPRPAEVIVVDDGSSDGSGEVAWARVPGS